MDPEQVAGPVTEVAPEEGAMQAPVGLSADAQQASPEEQELYDRFVSKAFMLIYDDGFLPKAVDMLGGEGDPMEGLARLTSTVVMQVMKAAQAGGQDLPGDVIFHGAKEVFEDLADLSRQAGVFDYSQDPDKLEGAYFRALDHFRMALQGEGGINEEAAKADLDMLQKMDADGELEGFFMKLAEGDAAAAGPAAGAEAPADGPPADAPPAPPKGAGLMPKGAM
jgi:hypothetical protein